jgi:ABC-type sugar transport system permease subunit
VGESRFSDFITGHALFAKVTLPLIKPVTASALDNVFIKSICNADVLSVGFIAQQCR